MSQIPSEADVFKMLDSLSNWGRWGADDQLGTLNFVTPDKRKRAAALVKEGVSVSCSRPISTEITADTGFQPMRFMVDSGEGRDTASRERILERRGAAEFIGMVFHGYTITHIDTPAHYFWDGRMYNGRSCNLITSREGAQVEAVDLLRDGVVSRGVLLDVAAVKGRWLDAGEGVMPEDLEAAEKAQGCASSRATSCWCAPATTAAAAPRARATRARMARRRCTWPHCRGSVNARSRCSAPTPTTT